MNTSPKVSIVIPAYKAASFIGETLKSVFAQTFTEYEVIIINDGSPDTEELERILDPYRERIHYLKQENRGAGAARNTGLQAARGEFIAFLDADDLWLPDYLAEQIKFIGGHNVDVVCADAILFNDSSVDRKTYLETLMSGRAEKGPVTFFGLVSAEQSLITSGIVARREPIFKVGLFDEALRNSQDFDLWLRLARHGARMAYQRRVLLRYRSHDESLSGNAFNIRRRELRVYDKIEQSYNLTPAERAEVLPAIRRRRAELEFELGKLYLANGEFVRARECFIRANTQWKSWKTQAAFQFSRTAPRLMQAIYLRRLGNAYAK